MTRKTYEIRALKVEINRLINLPDKDMHPQGRKALASFIEGLLMETNNYKGFNYTEWNNGGHKRWEEDGKPSDIEPYLGDRTKVTFY